VETFRTVVGDSDDENMRGRLRELEADGAVVYLIVPRSDLGRRRFKAMGSDGAEYGVALSSSEGLHDGSVLTLEATRAVVAKMEDEQTLTLRATSAHGGIQLGWHAGHLHWRVRFDGDDLIVLLDASAEEYLHRIEKQISDGSIEVVESP
jgi:urease accessory protein